MRQLQCPTVSTSAGAQSDENRRCLAVEVNRGTLTGY
jgi:hypothetical protein